ncbi:PspC domain-containing protein [Aestuariibacter sp. AA17]|uniref:PspC domain-containing protein n=1 Tax=Fluctibacter corallii TaxID=2984329 RepID=A0ABT3AEA5_9ALTE|nr:PspC domain-containing protein [Aestuariibacter sp. AA17]MCV2886642.1 PspC domain-containing protein [Aestuariibacter sp. AA17]
MKSYIDTQQLHRSTLNKKVSGVCAGLARHFDVSVIWVRLAAIVAFIMFPMPVAIAYLMAVLLLPKR